MALRDLDLKEWARQHNEAQRSLGTFSRLAMYGPCERCGLPRSSRACVDDGGIFLGLVCESCGPAEVFIIYRDCFCHSEYDVGRVSMDLGLRGRPTALG